MTTLNLSSSHLIELMLLLSLHRGPYFPRAVKQGKDVNRRLFSSLNASFMVQKLWKTDFCSVLRLVPVRIKIASDLEAQLLRPY